MLKSKNIKNFNERINRYNIYSNEKEIESEFYFFIKQYYVNKYSKISSGYIDYTAPYNIDGLLEVKTLEADYRILVEAKANKDYSNKKIRDEVLSQAIYYYRKLKNHNEQLPSILILLEAKSMVIINSEDIETFINIPSNFMPASNAYRADLNLLNELNNTKYNYKIIFFNNETNYNKIFNKIDKICSKSKYSRVKIDLTQNNYLKIGDFINNHKVFRNKSNYYYNNNNEYIKITLGALKIFLLNEVNLRAIGVKNGFSILEELISEIKISHICCNGEVINLETKIKENDSPYTISFNDVTYINNSGSYDYRILAEYLIDEKYRNEQLIIHINKENNKYIEKLFNKFNITYNFDYSNDYTYNSPGAVIFNDSKKLDYDFSINRNFKILNLDNFDGYSELISKLINSYDVFDHVKTNYSNKIIREWKESGDLIYGFLTEGFNVEADSFILILDLLDAFNDWLSERGNSKVSMRYFVEALQNHEYFIDSKLVYKKSTSIRKSLNQSLYQGSDLSNLPRKPGQKSTYVIGLKFKV